MFRVVGEDVGAELHFAARFVDAFAHFQGCQFGELVDIRAHQRCGLGNDFCTLCVARVLPRIEAGLSGGERLFKLFVGQLVEALQDLAVVGVDALVSHVGTLFKWKCA